MGRVERAICAGERAREGDPQRPPTRGATAVRRSMLYGEDVGRGNGVRRARRAGDGGAPRVTARIILFLILEYAILGARGRAEASRRASDGRETHRGEYRGHIARWEGSEPARVASGGRLATLARAPHERPSDGNRATTEGSRGSARSRPETAATSGSRPERGVGPSTALSLCARSVRRGVTARAFLRFPRAAAASPRWGGKSALVVSNHPTRERGR